MHLKRIKGADNRAVSKDNPLSLTHDWRKRTISNKTLIINTFEICKYPRQPKGEKTNLLCLRLASYEK